MPTTTAALVETTELQKSIFNAPPSTIPAKPAAPNGLKPVEVELPKPPQGVKRPREDEGENEGVEEGDEEEASMEEDDESDAPMEASSDED